MRKFTGDIGNWTFHDSTFSREIRRVNRNRIILALIVFAVIFYFDTIGTIFRARIYFSGPKAVTHEEISAVTDPETELKYFGFSANTEKSDVFTDNPKLKRLMFSKGGSCYVSLTPVSVKDSGLKAYTSSGSDTNVEYVLGQLSTGKYLLIKRSAIVRLDKASGTISYLPSDLRAEVLGASDVGDADLLPLIMDATGETFSSVKTDIGFTALLLALWGLWFFFIVRRAMNINRDPAYNRIFMCSGSVEDNARQIDEELQAPDVFTSGRVTVTESWRLTSKLFSFTAEPKSSAEK